MKLQIPRHDSRIICEVLNKLIWKLPGQGDFRTTEEYANFLIAEIKDIPGNMFSISWNNKKEIFEPHE